MPPRCWMHNYDIKDKDGKTLKDFLEDSNLPVPYHWHDEDMTIFDQACFGIVPDITGHDPNE